MKLNSQDLQEYFTVQHVLDSDASETIRKHIQYLNPITAGLMRFIGSNRKFVRAEGIELIDDRGNTYLDFLSGFGSLNLGHEPLEVIEALRMVEGRPNFFQASLNPFAGHLAEFLAAVAPGELSRTFFCNSGAEAVEAAIKLARCATGKSLLVSAIGAFHGKTMGALSVSGKQKYKKPFEPLIPDTQVIPYNDITSLELVLRSSSVAAVLLEPIQGEAGVIVPSVGYLRKAEELCRKYKALLIIDEIQTGMSRTGTLFCCEHEQIQPDIMCLSKSLGGGVMPIGAMMTTDQLWKAAYGSLDTALLHSSTFGGNTRACACGIAALNTIIRKNLACHAHQEGDYLLSRLKELKNKYPVIKEVRGQGLMIGIHFHRLKGKIPFLEGGLTLWIVRELFNRHRIITAFTLNNYDIMRIMPPLIVTRVQIDRFLEALEDVLNRSNLVYRLRLIE